MKINQRAVLVAALAAFPMGAAFAPSLRTNEVRNLGCVGFLIAE
jgi:hypothetical protein